MSRPVALLHRSSLCKFIVAMFLCVVALSQLHQGFAQLSSRPMAFILPDAVRLSQYQMFWTTGVCQPAICCCLPGPANLSRCFQQGIHIFPMSQRNCNILCWNVRGLNDVVRQDAVNLLVKDTAATIVCPQETKLQNVDQAVVRRLVGAKFTNNFVVLPVNEDFCDLSSQQLSTNAVTATCTMRADGTSWQITVVYGPQGDAEKLQFLQELKAIRLSPSQHMGGG